MNLSALADFNAVVLHGGFGRASRATGRPKASLSRRIAQLEEELGVRLFQRGAHALALTEEGQALHANTAGRMSELEEAADAVSSSSKLPAGRLRISAPTLYATESLGRLAAAYIAAYPNVQIEIVAEDRFVDPIADDYEVVIRANPALNSELAGRCILRDDLVIVAPPGMPKPAADGAVHGVPAATLLSATGKDPWRVDGVDGMTLVQPIPVAKFSSISMVRDAVRAGAGAAVLPLSRVQADLHSGTLQLWGNLKDRHVEVWALFASRRHLSPKIKTFVTLLTEQFQKTD